MMVERPAGGALAPDYELGDRAGDGEERPRMTTLEPIALDYLSALAERSYALSVRYEPCRR